MPHKKKKFIDKKNAVTFHLVHRSQRDPLQASDEASQRILLPVDQKEIEKRREEQQKYGVFFDDDYNYMQHLKEVDEAYELEPVDRVHIPAPASIKGTKLQLPSSVFASEVETDIGLLNKAATVKGPRPDWDPDIVAALDDDFQYDDPDNILDDDFIEMANAPLSEGEEFEGDDDEFASDEADMSDEDMDLENFKGDPNFMSEETKSHFTNYSMSSSVIRRNQGLTLLDDRFEKFYEQFEDSEIGALDHEEIDGSVAQGSHMLNSILEEFEKEQEQTKLKDVVDENEADDIDVNSEGSDTEMVKMVIEEPKEKWDCESILSTYSNLYNHPKLIEESKTGNRIELTARLGIPSNIISTKQQLTRKQIEQEMRANQRADKASTYRPKDETVKEKKSRKQAIKEERKERRMEKKANKQTFSKEKIRQEKEIKNLKNNLQGVKIV